MARSNNNAVFTADTTSHGDVKHYRVTTTNGVITVIVERADSWADTGTGTPASPQTAAAANMQVFLRAMGTVRCRASSTSESTDPAETAAVDISGTTVAVVANI